MKKVKSRKIVRLSAIKTLHMKDKALSNPNKTDDELNFHNSENKSKCQKIIEWTVHGKLLVLFASNLIVCGQMIDAIKVIESYGLNFKEDPLVIANMHFKIIPWELMINIIYLIFT